MSSMHLLFVAVPMFFAGVLALTLGFVALARINRSGGALRGRGLAIAAIILGLLLLVSPALILVSLLGFKAGGFKAGGTAPAPPPTATRQSATSPLRPFQETTTQPGTIREPEDRSR